jgi:hypothetical protein
MHDRAARPAGVVKSAAAIATGTMILLNIDLRIPQVRPRVEKSVQRFRTLSHAHVHTFLVRCSVRLSSAHHVAGPTFSAETAEVAAADFRLHFSQHFARKKGYNSFPKS